MERKVKRRWYQFSLASLFVLTTLVALWFGYWPRLQAYWAVQRMTNDDIDVDGSLFGIMVYVKGDRATEILRLGKHARPALVRALDDPDKFAAAHILLTLIENEMPVGGRMYPLAMFAPLQAGIAKKQYFVPEQIPELQEHWRKRIAGQANRDTPGKSR